jgi:hypothetical protein
MSNNNLYVHNINDYILKNFNDISNYHLLLAEIMQETNRVSRGGKKNKNQTIILSQLRQLCIYSTPTCCDMLNESLINALFSLITNASDYDFDRKILRASLYTICEIIISNNIKEPDITFKDSKVATSLISILRKEISNNKTIGCRLFLSWRTLGILSNISGQSINVMEISYDTLSKLKYPTLKSKKSMFGTGQKKIESDFENKMLYWATLLSTMRRTGEIPPLISYDILFSGAISSNSHLSRHALYLISLAATKRGDNNCQEPDNSPSRLASILNKKLSIDMPPSQTVNQADLLSCTYILQTVASLAENPDTLEKNIINLYKSSKIFIEHFS